MQKPKIYGSGFRRSLSLVIKAIYKIDIRKYVYYTSRHNFPNRQPSISKIYSVDTAH